MSLFNKSAPYYDVIYDAAGKNYKAESKQLRQLIPRHKKSKGNALLDVACGTGRHILYLKSSYSVEGLDLDPRLLAIANKRNPEVRFHKGNMLTFTLRKEFDVVTCLFSAIGYMTTLRKLRRAVRNMRLHLKPGGVLIVEPWITPRNFIRGNIHAVFVNEAKLKIARIGRSTARGRISHFRFSISCSNTTRHAIFQGTRGVWTFQAFRLHDRVSASWFEGKLL